MQRFCNEFAVLECRRTPWDERVFGFPCAEITCFQTNNLEAGLAVLDQFEVWVINQNVNFAYGRFESKHIVKQIVHKAGFYFAEASYRIHNNKIRNSANFDHLIRRGPLLELAHEADYGALQKILASDFDYGRIHEDPWIEPAKASLRYHNWLEDLTAQSHEIYTYRLNNEIIGIHVQRCEGAQVDMVLTGVKRSHALLGASLWASVIQLNRKLGMATAQTIISASNIPIVNLYRFFEFQFDEILLGYHKRWPPGV